MFRVLEKYQVKGNFSFKRTDNLSVKCNAPYHSSGIYTIYAEEINPENLIYIGISGREGKDGKIIHRKDGIGGRIVKGKQFGEGRRKSWPKKMKEDSIQVIYVKWYVTFGEFDNDFPRTLENKFLSVIDDTNGRLPIWNKET